MKVMNKLIITIFALIYTKSILSEPILNLVCDPDRIFRIQVDKQELDYVELYAKGFMDDERCSRVSAEASERNFEFEIDVNVESQLPCGVLYHEDSDTYEIEFYIAGQKVILTAKDSLYDASCNFQRTMHRVTTTNTHERQSDSPQTRSDQTPEGLQYRRLTAAEDTRTASMRIFSPERGEFTNNADIGEDIQLVLVLNTENTDFTGVEYAAECTMYSSENKQLESKYMLTNDVGCPSETNSLFEDPFSDAPEAINLLLQATEKAISTAVFRAPYYPETGQLFFECVVEFCNGDEPSGHPCNRRPDCSAPKNTRRQRQAVNA